jgi:hypothetical protein
MSINVQTLRAIKAVKAEFTVKSIEHMDAAAAQQLPRLDVSRYYTDTKRGEQ